MGGNDRRVAEIDEGQAAEEVVHGVQSGGLTAISRAKAKFPITVPTEMPRNKRKRGSWSSGCCIKPIKMNRVAVE